MVDYLAMAREQNVRLRGFEADVHGLTIEIKHKETVYAVSVVR